MLVSSCDLYIYVQSPGLTGEPIRTRDLDSITEWPRLPRFLPLVEQVTRSRIPPNPTKLCLSVSHASFDASLSKTCRPHKILHNTKAAVRFSVHLSDSNVPAWRPASAPEDCRGTQGLASLPRSGTSAKSLDPLNNIKG